MLKVGDKVKLRCDLYSNGIWDWSLLLEKGEAGVVVADPYVYEYKDAKIVVCCDIFVERKGNKTGIPITELFLESGTLLEKLEHLAFSRQLKKNKDMNVKKCLEKRKRDLVS